MNAAHASAKERGLQEPRSSGRGRGSQPLPGAVPGAAPGAPLSPLAGLACFAVTAAFDLISGLHAFPTVLAGSLVNPDSYMRLVRLRDMIAHHTMVYGVARDASGAGTTLHWSHLLDGLMLLLAGPLSLALGQQKALHWAAVAIGPISLGLLAVAAAWAMAPFSHPRWRWLAPALVVLSPKIIGYALPGEVHHHILVALAIVMTAGYALRSAWRGAAAGRMMGVSAAAGIWLTPESMPLTLAAVGGLGLFWLLHPENKNPGRALRSAGTSFLVVIAAALAVDPPANGYLSPTIDRLSVVYLGLAAAVCGIGWAAWWLDGCNLTPLRRGAGGVLIGLAGIAAWLGAFPSVLAGPDGLMSAEQTHAFLDAIAEMQPIRSTAAAVALLGGGVVAAVAAGFFAQREHSPVWGYAALCGGLAVVLALMHMRFATYSELFAAAMLPVIVSALDKKPERRTAPYARIGVIAAFLFSPQAAGLANLSSAPSATAASGSDCDARRLQAPLRPYAGQVVLSDPGESPGLLYWTELRTVGSLFHRNADAFMRLRAAWRSPPSDGVPEAVRATQAALVVVCPHPGRSLLVADLPPDTLLDRLNAGRPPPWLVPLDIPDAPGYRLYRVVPPAAATGPPAAATGPASDRLTPPPSRQPAR